MQRGTVAAGRGEGKLAAAWQTSLQPLSAPPPLPSPPRTSTPRPGVSYFSLTHQVAHALPTPVAPLQAGKHACHQPCWPSNPTRWGGALGAAVPSRAGGRVRAAVGACHVPPAHHLHSMPDCSPLPPSQPSPTLGPRNLLVSLICPAPPKSGGADVPRRTITLNNPRFGVFRVAFFLFPLACRPLFCVGFPHRPLHRKTGGLQPP